MPRKIARRITADYLHNAALFYLERYAASTGRLRQVLTRKVRRSCTDHPDQDMAAAMALVEAEIQKLERIELLKDNQLAQQMTEGMRGRGMAGRMIEVKLKQRGFTADVITHTMAQTQDVPVQEAEIDAAIRYLRRRKLGPYAAIDEADKQAAMKIKQKSWAALARQGYDPDIITAALKPSTQDA